MLAGSWSLPMLSPHNRPLSASHFPLDFRIAAIGDLSLKYSDAAQAA
jgi:hypothetical protein